MAIHTYLPLAKTGNFSISFRVAAVDFVNLTLLLFAVVFVAFNENHYDTKQARHTNIYTKTRVYMTSCAVCVCVCVFAHGLVKRVINYEIYVCIPV